MNSPQSGRLWRVAPGKISMQRMEHTPRCRPSWVLVNPMPTEGGRTSQFSIKSENTPVLARISQEVTERFYNLLRICGHALVFHAIFTFSHHPVAAPNIQPLLAHRQFRCLSRQDDHH